MTLNSIRTIAARILEAYEDEGSNGIDQDDAADLASGIEALDKWLSKDGFLPKDWEVK